MNTEAHFRDSFWSPSIAKEDIPNYAKGLRALHARLEHSVQENKVITDFILKRVNNELQCAQLAAIETKPVSMHAGLKNAFEMVFRESTDTARFHRVRAGILTQDVLQPLLDFTRRFQDKIQTRKNRMEDEVSAFDHTAQTALMVKSVYWSKCRAVELACPDFRPPLPEGFEEQQDEEDDTFVGDQRGRRRRSSSVTSELNVDGGVKLGKYTVLPYREVARSMNRLQTMVEGVKTTTTDGTAGARKFLGKDIFEWIRDFMVTVQHHDVTLDTESQEICQQLVALKFLKSVPKESPGFSMSSYYEVQKNVVERYLRKIRIKENGQSSRNQPDPDPAQNTTLEVPSGGDSGPMGVLNGFFGKLHFTTTKSGKAALTEMKEADEAYKKKIKLVNKLRRQLEESMVAYFDEMEQLEKNRIQTIKQSFKTMATALSNILPMYKETYDRIDLFQDALKPEQDIHSIIEQFKTGYFYPKPFIYENYYHGAATDQMFGVPLEEVTQVYGSYIPPVISKSIKIIDRALAMKSSSKDTDKASRDIWSNVIPIKKMNEYCQKLDGLIGDELKETLETFDLNVLANLIRVYLLELPECLLTFELYNPVKNIYATQQDAQSRLSSVRKLLSTLPPSNYHTLKALSFHLFKLLNQSTAASTADDMLNKLISMFGFILMRPRTSSTTHVHDRHPKKLARDLFTQYHQLFLKESNKAEEESYFNRRPAQPLRIESTPSMFKDHSRLGLRRTLSLTPRNDFDDEYCYSPGGSLILPQARMTLLFDDPDHGYSTPTTPTQQQVFFKEFKGQVDDSDIVDAARLSSDLDLILSTDDDEEDSVAEKKVSNRSRSSTKSTMDNVVLDSFFDD